MNSSFHFPNFLKSLKSTKAEFSIYDTPKPNAAERNKFLEASNLGAAGAFSSFPGGTSTSPSLNISDRSAAPHPDQWVQAEIEETDRKNAVVEATANFFREKVPSPEFFGTFTYDKEVRKETGTRIFLEYLRKIAKRVGSHFRVAWGAGYQGLRRAYHHHFLIERVPSPTEFVSPSVTADHLMGLWDYGIAKVEPYDFEKGTRDRGAAYYIANHEDTDVWVACTRTKRCKGPGGCKVERSIW